MFGYRTGFGRYTRIVGCASFPSASEVATHLVCLFMHTLVTAFDCSVMTIRLNIKALIVLHWGVGGEEDYKFDVTADEIR